ncbi:MAG: hypothetical protein FWE57_04985 [Chitinispirillia bacterium]|nr:hypothetical protein [Chitinispirillia bacterium]
MANDTRLKGGWADRLCGIITLYKICKLYGFRFKINFTTPFDLSIYLHPGYDWKISEDEITQNNANSRSISSFVTGIDLPQYTDTLQCHNLDFNGLSAVIEKNSKNYKYLLLYTNIWYWGDDYGILFNELFSLSPKLQNAVDFHRNKINSEYIAAAFRFQSLLGDFDENEVYNNIYPALPVELQEEFLQRNINHLIKIHKSNKRKMILVCSDSERFRDAAAVYDFVYTVGGKRRHLDVPEIEKQYVMLTLIDFFMITYSDTVYLILDGVKDNGTKYESYNSGFPRWASRLGNINLILKDYRPFFTKVKRYKDGFIRHFSRLTRLFRISGARR